MLTHALLKASISYDRFHVIALANEALEAVCRDETRTPAAVGADDWKGVKRLFWAIRKNPESWNRKQIDNMHWLQRSNLKSAQAWWLKRESRAVCAQAVVSNDETVAGRGLRGLAVVGPTRPAGAVQTPSPDLG